MYSQDDLLARRQFVYSMQVVLNIPKHPHLLEAELYCLWNATFVAMVKAGRPNKGKHQNEASQRHGHGSDATGGTVYLVGTKKRHPRGSNVGARLWMVSIIRDSNHYTTELYDD